MVLASYQVITGEPGSSWTNATDKIWYQAHVNFRNSCAVCIAVAGRIARWWPFPFHFGCLCENVPVAPGETAKPFIDYEQAVAELDPAQQAAAMGTSNWQLVKSGLAEWSDVVTKSRVRDFREVVSRLKLSVDDLVNAGVQRTQAEKAYRATHTAAHVAASQTRQAIANALKQHGLTHEAITREAGLRLARRIGIKGGPSGPSFIGSLKRPPPGYGGAAAMKIFGPKAPITPLVARARLAEVLGEEIAAKIDLTTIKTEADLQRVIEIYSAPPGTYEAEQRAFGEYLGFSSPPSLLHSPDRDK